VKWVEEVVHSLGRRPTGHPSGVLPGEREKHHHLYDVRIVGIFVVVAGFPPADELDAAYAQVKLGRLVEGELAETLAHADETIRRHREERRAQEMAEREILEDLAAPALEVREAVRVLARASLVAAGYHNHHGDWRRKREWRDSA
jgi:hypothetical protein